MSVNYAECSAEMQVHYRAKKRKNRKDGNISPKAPGPREMAIEQRPRERLISKGPAYLSDAELLAVLLNTGIKGKNVFQLAQDLLKLLDRSREIPPIHELSKLSGMGDTKVCAVAAMLELGRRRWGATGAIIKYPEEIYALVRHYADRKQERFISLSLNGAHEVIAVRVVTIGLVNKTIVHPREVFADLIQDRAAAFAVAHNHPSRLLEPSPEDDEVTERLLHASKILGLHFIDHVIFSETAWWSYRYNGKLMKEE